MILLWKFEGDRNRLLYDQKGIMSIVLSQRRKAHKERGGL